MKKKLEVTVFSACILFLETSGKQIWNIKSYQVSLNKKK